MTTPTNGRSRTSLWPVYAFSAFLVVGFALATLSVRTCI